MNAQCLYAVGDIHGRFDLLKAALRFIEQDRESKGSNGAVIFLGDIVDRGPNSREALDLVATTLDRLPPSKLIRGNHDQWFLDFLAGGEPHLNWLLSGGMETLGSYADLECSFEQIRDRINSEYPHHRAILQNSSQLEIWGRYCLVHAGIDPLRPLNAQTWDDCLWIRDRFLDHVGPLPYMVVHGHTPTAFGRPVMTENRISLDTGAFKTGLLCFAVLPADDDQKEQFYAAISATDVIPIEPVQLSRDS